MFDLVQEQVKSQVIRSETKEFAFTRLMECGLCGSSISADEKFKKQSSGEMRRHVYYGCTKVRDRNCKCGYINEVDLVKQFQILIEQVDLNEIGIKDKIKREVERFKKFQRILLGVSEPISIVDVNIRNYAKFMLKEGEDFEKRELLACLKSKIILVGKDVSLKQSPTAT